MISEVFIGVKCENYKRTCMSHSTIMMMIELHVYNNTWPHFVLLKG